ncbi:hypothetical protein P7C70_g9344, partial [Phenoliferia sp. Uapishka_3]
MPGHPPSLPAEVVALFLRFGVAAIPATLSPTGRILPNTDRRHLLLDAGAVCWLWRDEAQRILYETESIFTPRKNPQEENGARHWLDSWAMNAPLYSIKEVRIQNERYWEEGFRRWKLDAALEGFPAIPGHHHARTRNFDMLCFTELLNRLGGGLQVLEAPLECVFAGRVLSHPALDSEFRCSRRAAEMT